MVHYEVETEDYYMLCMDEHVSTCSYIERQKKLMGSACKKN